MRTTDDRKIQTIIQEKTRCKLQVSQFFSQYPLEYIEQRIGDVFNTVLPEQPELYFSNAVSLFYEELNQMLKNCRDLYVINKDVEALVKSSNIDAVVNFLREVIPVSYIFCSSMVSGRNDFIIVMDRYKYKPLDEVTSLLELMIGSHKNINCTVYSYGSIHNFLSKGHLYFSSLCIPQNCVYQNEVFFSLPTLTARKLNELIEKSTLLFKENIKKADTFFASAVQLANSRENAISLFMLQQACELSYRALLLTLRGKQVKSHDLEVLRKHIAQFAPLTVGQFSENEDEELKTLGIIQDSYIKSRYYTDYSVDGKDLMKIIPKVEKLINAVKKTFDTHIKQVNEVDFST